MNLSERLRPGPSIASFRPVVLDLRRRSDRLTAEGLFRAGEVAEVVDQYAEQKRELAVVRKPELLGGKMRNPARSSEKEGRWVYLPWRKTLVHVLGPADYRALRRSRNFDLILPSEQKLLEKFRVAVAGLNVGNPAALCLVLEGMSRMKFADNDHLSVSNLNRFRAGIAELGVNKAVLSARQAYEVDPYADIDVYPQGLAPDNIKRFLARTDVLVEEMDNLKLKIAVREEARRMRIPVVMATGNGENVIVDIERFDREPRLPLLSGHLRRRVVRGIEALEPATPLRTKLMLARDFMGVRHLDPRLRSSFLRVGSALAGIPQIAESSFLRGAAVAYVIRRIATGAKVPSGRYNLKAEHLFRS